MQYYFAYGSNMDRYQMEERCPNAIRFGIALIPNYRIDFTRKSIKRKGGVADIIKCEGNQVWGLIYSLNDEDIYSLDKFEGYPKYYRKEKIICYKFEDPTLWGFTPEIPLQEHYENLYKNPFNFTEINVFIYTVIDKSSYTIQPSIEYLQLLQKAAEENYFPITYQETLNSFGQELRSKLNSNILDLFIELTEKIEDHNFNETINSIKEFGGADLVITGNPERKKYLNENHPLDLVILTPYWKELSWIVTNIYNSEHTQWLFNSYNKYIFLKDFGEALLKYQGDNPNDKNHIGICKAGIANSYSLLTKGGLLSVE